jgi:hypothetical protein
MLFAFELILMILKGNEYFDFNLKNTEQVLM